MLKKTITAIAVDSARDYFKERLNELKELDLDKDGRKDVDQCAELLVRVGEKVKDALESTDFQTLAGGLEQIMSGVGMISGAVDKEKLTVACEETIVGLRQLGKLLHLGVVELKEKK